MPRQRTLSHVAAPLALLLGWAMSAGTSSASAATFTPLACAGGDFGPACSLAELQTGGPSPGTPVTVAYNGVVLSGWNSDLTNPQDIKVTFAVPALGGAEMAFTRLNGTTVEPLVSSNAGQQLNYTIAAQIGHIITEAVMGVTGARATGLEGVVGIEKQMTVGSNDAFIDLGCKTATCPANGALGLGVTLAPAFYGGFSVKDLFVASSDILDGASFDVLTQSFFAPVPEPATLALVSLGMLGMAAVRRARSN